MILWFTADFILSISLYSGLNINSIFILFIILLIFNFLLTSGSRLIADFIQVSFFYYLLSLSAQLLTSSGLPFDYGILVILAFYSRLYLFSISSGLMVSIHFYSQLFSFGLHLGRLPDSLIVCFYLYLLLFFYSLIILSSGLLTS